MALKNAKAIKQSCVVDRPSAYQGLVVKPMESFPVKRDAFFVLDHMGFFVYIIQSQKDYSYYIGYTADLEVRLDKHNKGLSTYTKRKLPWKLVYFEHFDTKSEAIMRERFLKQQKNREFYERLIDTFSKR